MNNNIKTILMLAAFIILLGASAFAYNSLSRSVSPEGAVSIAEPIQKAEKEAEPVPGAETKAENELEAKPEAQPGEQERVTAPDFTVHDAEGNEVKLSDMLGTPVVLNFWASWCPPCKSEMPMFDDVYNDPEIGVEFMMVDLVDGMRETKEDGESYIEGEGFTFPVYYDTNQEAGAAYGVGSIPMTLFIDKDGKVAAGARGAINEETLRKGIDLIR